MLLQFDWFTLTIISVVSWSLTTIIQKAALKGEEVNASSFSALFQILVGLITIPIAITGFKTLPHGIGIWSLVVLSSFLYFIANFLFFYSLKDIEASQSTIITSTRAIWFMILGLIFFREIITAYKLFGISLIILGLVIIYFNKGSFKSFSIKHFYLLIYALIFSLANTLDKYILNYFDPSAYQVIAFLLPALFTLIFIPGTLKGMKPLVKVNKNNFYLLTSSITYTIAALSLYTSYKVGAEISKAGSISQASIIITVLLGIVFLKERENLAKKIIGSIIVFAGVMLLKIM